jgi:alpha-aminoadipic semialdehyde synthase
MVAGPAVEEIAKREDVQLLIGADFFLLDLFLRGVMLIRSVASNSYAEASKLAQYYTNVAYRVVDLKEEESWAGLVAEADVVIRCVHVGPLYSP